MSAKVFTILNEKGGCGKTTLATTLAAGLATRGRRVVLIDADAQGQVAMAFGLAKEPAFYDLIVRGASWKEALRLIPVERYAVPDAAPDIRGQLFIVPSNVETRSIASNISDAFAVFNRVGELREHVDYILFDTAPSPSLLHASIYMASDYILHPTLPETWSFDGLKESMAHRQMFDGYRAQYQLPPIQIAGIVPLRYNARTLEHRENFNDLKTNFGTLVWTPIPNRTIWTETTTARRAIFGYAPTSKAAKEAWGLVDRLEAVLYEPA